MPVPERATVWGLLMASSLSVIVAARVPVAAGLKVTLTVQLAFAAMLDPQLLVCEKSLELVPDTTMPVMFKAALPEFESENACAELAVLTG